MSDVALMTGLPEIARVRAASMTPMEASDVVLKLGGATVLDGVTFRLRPGGCTVIMGPNGAGKSLLLKLLHGLIRPTSGRVEWNGKPATEVTSRQSLVFQKPVLLRRSVMANLDFVLRARGADRSRREELLAHVGLEHKAEQPARLLSGGEAQRLAMARALATEPDVLLLDAPTASLDPASVLAIEKIMADARDRGVRTILVTHDPGQARRMADEVIFLHGGQVAEHAAASDFFSGPQCQVALDFMNGRIVV